MAIGQIFFNFFQKGINDRTFTESEATESCNF